MPRDQYQSVHDVADRLKVNEATVRQWIKDNDLRAIYVGKAWRISDADLDDFLRRHETRPRQNGLTSNAAPPRRIEAAEADRQET